MADRVSAPRDSHDRAGGRRRTAAVVSGVVLAVFALATFAVVNDGRAGAEEGEKGAAGLAVRSVLLQQGLSSSSTDTGDKDNTPKLLSDEERDHIKSKIKELYASVNKERKDASKLESEVQKKEGALRSLVVKAKEERTKGDTEEEKAKEDVAQAGRLRERAEKLREKSDEAKKDFLAQERPVEMATQLSSHDHHQYRKDELAVAQDVTLLSEHPDNAKLRKMVDALVAKAKASKEKMVADRQILSKLQEAAASSTVDGQQGYAELKDQSVHIAKRAESVAQKAVDLASEGHKQRVDADELVKKVQAAMRGPEALHKKAESERTMYQHEQKEIKELRESLDQDQILRDKEEKEEEKKKARDSDVGGDGDAVDQGGRDDEHGGDDDGDHEDGHHDQHEARVHEHEHRAKKSGSDYDEEREELEKDVKHDEDEHPHHQRRDRDEDDDDDGGDDKKESRQKLSDSTDSSRIDDAENSYDKIEHAAFMREKAAAQRRAKHEGDDNSGDDDGQEMKAKDRAGLILSPKQSTFLSGLFSHTAPWDSRRDLSV